MLALAVPNFPLVGYHSRDIREFVIEHGGADLKRRQHRHTINLNQHIAGQLCGRLKVQSLRKWIRFTGEKAVGKNLFQIGTVAGHHPLLPKQFSSHQSRSVIAFEIAPCGGRAADHVQIVLAWSGIRKPVRHGRDGTPERLRQRIEPFQILNDLETFVTSKEFVATIPAQRNLNVLRREFRDNKGGNCRGIRKGLIELTDQPLGKIDRIRLHDNLVMLSFILFGDSGRERKFIKGCLLETDRKRLNGVWRLQGHGCHDGTGIDATAQERTQRNVGNHSDSDGFVELVSNFPAGIFDRESGRGFGRAFRILPVAALLDGTIRAIFQPATRLQFSDCAINGKGIWNVGELEVEAKGFPVQFERNTCCSQTFQLTPEIETFRKTSVVKRLFTETIPHQQNLPRSRIPDAKCKHAPKPMQTCHAFLLIKMDQDFGIAVSFEKMALCNEPLAKLFVVVDFTVKNNPNRTVFIRDWLMSRCQVDNAEPPHTDRARAFNMKSLVIGTAVSNDVAHRLDHNLTGLAVPVEITCYAAHSAEVPLALCYCECRPVRNVFRSPREIRFRLWQHFENLRLLVFPPVLSPDREVAALPLPDGRITVETLRGSAYAAEMERLANEIVSHKFPLFGFQVETGPNIEWRKDYVSGKTTGTDYFRQIPYLDFNKAGDHKVIWELNRHQHLVLLAQAWLLTSNSAYLSEIEAELESWFFQNPFLRGINYASALEVAFRALSWLWVDHLAGPALRPQIRSQLLNALYQQGYFLRANLSTYFSPNTHLLGEGVALHALGLKFPKTGWQQLGNRILSEERDRQIQTDGSHFEQSTYYHVYALDLFVFYYLMAGRPAGFEAAIRRMASFLGVVIGPAGLLSFFGDDDGGRLFHPFGNRAGFGRATLATCARVFPELLVPTYPSALAEQSDWWLGPSADIRSVSLPDAVVHYADSGLVSLTRGELHILIDTGPFGPGGAGHSHSDTLSLTVRRGSEELLIDPGTFTYVSDQQARDDFRGSSFHNTIRVDGLDQAAPTKPFRWENKPRVGVATVREENETVYVEAACEYRGISHKRQIVLESTRALTIVDHLTGPTGEHLIEQFWHGKPGICVSDAPAQPEQVEGWRSRCLGSKEQSPVTVYRWRGIFPITITTEIRLT